MAIILAVMLCVIAYQDLKERAISAWVTFAIIALTLTNSILIANWELLKAFSINIVLLLSQLLFIKLYFSYKAGHWLRISDKLIGKGDLYILVATCLYWGPIGFMIFYITSLTLTLFAFAIWKAKSHSTEVDIPLAAGIASLWVVFISIEVLFGPLSRYDSIKTLETIALW